MAGAPTPSAGPTIVPQIICQADACTTLQVPPFQPSPQQPPNNVLTIQSQIPSPCPPYSDPEYLTAAISDYEIKQARLGCGAPLRMVTGTCFAAIYGCPLFSGDVGCIGASWDETVNGPPQLDGSPPGPATLRFDSDPNFDQKVLAGTLDCAAPLVITNPPPPPLPPTGNGLSCHDGSAPSLAPCGPGQCYENGVGCCPCDPPLPYGGSGPLVEGSQNSTESYWTSAPAPLGLPTPELLEDDPLARIAPDVQPIGAPLAIPLPTSSIAVTACNSCAGDGDEIDELVSA
jgi:hypothetical protein